MIQFAQLWRDVSGTDSSIINTNILCASMRVFEACDESSEKMLREVVLSTERTRACFNIFTVAITREQDLHTLDHNQPIEYWW